MSSESPISTVVRATYTNTVAGDQTYSATSASDMDMYIQETRPIMFIFKIMGNKRYIVAFDMDTHEEIPMWTGTQKGKNGPAIFFLPLYSKKTMTQIIAFAKTTESKVQIPFTGSNGNGLFLDKTTKINLYLCANDAESIDYHKRNSSLTGTTLLEKEATIISAYAWKNATTPREAGAPFYSEEEKTSEKRQSDNNEDISVSITGTAKQQKTA